MFQRAVAIGRGAEISDQAGVAFGVCIEDVTEKARSVPCLRHEPRQCGNRESRIAFEQHLIHLGVATAVSFDGNISCRDHAAAQRSVAEVHHK